MKFLLIAVIIQGALSHKYHDMPKCPDPIDGKWEEWREWSPCTVSCGIGYKTRVRYCVNPRPQHGGNPCTGKATETETCDMGLCPVDGEHGEWKYTQCTKECDGGTQIRYKECHPPKDKEGLCYKGCPDVAEVIPCNTQPCDACYHCKETAEMDGDLLGVANFVGHACRVDQKFCAGLTGGIKKMYPSNHWFFLHCSADGPWCKPCATRGLVYNAKCGQCELTADGECTGPGHWRQTTATPIGGTQTTKSIISDVVEEEDEDHRRHPRYRRNPCGYCAWKAKRYGELLGHENFVGYPCRTKQYFCKHKYGGIHDMYPAKKWFFLQCSADGPWCKPCATRNLVYNPHCGACETTRDGECTGEHHYHKEEEHHYHKEKGEKKKPKDDDDDMW